MGTDITKEEMKTQLIGHSRVEAVVFGGGRNTWRLALKFRLRKNDGRWQFTEASASTY